MRIALAKVLLESPDILLLDEPTNYLDIEARTWLEAWLKAYDGGYLLVSHDRYFLDSTIQEVYELFQGKLNRYVGNYSVYENIRQAELDALLKRYAEQQEEIARTEDIIRRFRYKASKAAMVQERVKRLEKLERIEIPEALKKISITFPPPPHAGRVALNAAGITKRYGNNQVLSNLELLLESGEKLVVVGRNGAGKSTLLRILAGVDCAFEGAVQYGTGIVYGYFSQESAELLTSSEPVLEFIEAQAPTALIPKVRDMLGAFLFRGDDVYKPVNVLSGGEKSRLALLRMLLKPLNMLILDEPTNHLDLHSKDILLSTLKAYSGTVIFVSHDRSFIEGLSTKTLELSAGHHRLFYGGYAYYVEKTAVLPEAPVVHTEPKHGEAKLNREIAKSIRRFKRQEEDILSQLDELEKEKAFLEAELLKPEVYSIHEKAQAVQERLVRTGALIDEATVEWERVMEQLEQVGLP